MVDVLVAWALFTTLLGGMAVAGWIACERKREPMWVYDSSNQFDNPGFEDADNPWETHR